MGKTVLSDSQNTAANPAMNVWVQANAGTGKTSVLIQRLLRILFRSDDENTGILCLTYTNAAAAEMRSRILGSIMNWATASDEELADMLDGVAYSMVPSAEDLVRARMIFYKVIDNPEIIKIKTLHGFCEEILRRFPIEAGISPSWSLVSDAAQKRLQSDAFEKLVNSKNSDQVTNAFSRIVGKVSEYSLDGLLGILTMRYKQFFTVTDLINFRKQFVDNIGCFLDLYSSIQAEISHAELQKIVDMAVAEQNSLKKPVKYLDEIIIKAKQFIDNSINFAEYKKAWLTADETKISNVAKKDFLVPEQDRVYALRQREINQEIFEDTVALFDLSAAFAATYSDLKKERAVLDFDDLILYVRRLFSSPDSMGWVLSQLDFCTDHILVDEAQDTSPEQWDILKAFTADFFVEGDKGRFMFVVGDTKQSIYGFQGADPAAFEASREYIAAQIKNNSRKINDVGLVQSFRSTRAVLETVDHFFNSLPGFENNEHKCFRADTAGCVELWPLRAKTDDKTAAVLRREYTLEIADKIVAEIASGTKPGDIMVLVQRRNPFASPLVAELKKRGISVAGSDRIVLPEFPAIRDLLNLVRFCTDETDDYSLACVLKSPLVGLSEADLYDVCKAPGENLLSKLAAVCPSIHAKLVEFREWSESLAPYSFFMKLLNTDGQRQKMIGALGTQILEPLEEFLTICLSYERTQPGGLRHFIKWFIEGGAEIKRETSPEEGVRIATVHGSKGLEAKVIFLIDTVRTPRDKPDPLVVLGKGGAWLWAARGGSSERLNAAKEAALQEKMAEYWRLLYVAMTRARDKLYIYGMSQNKTAPSDSWHSKLFEILPSKHDAQNGDCIKVRCI